MSAYKIEFEIQGLPPMANIASGKSHWRHAHAQSVKWKQAVAVSVGKRRPIAPLKKATLTLTRHSSSAPDYDGLVRGFKYVVDGLRECGVLADDKMANTGPWNCFWILAPQRQGKISVRVEEVTS